MGSKGGEPATTAGTLLAAAEAAPAPVEYAVAVDRYLAAAALGASSRRVYRISLASWAWPLVGRRPPPGRQRRGALPPVVPLALLDDEHARPRLAAALAERARTADPRTISRELSALRSAVGWWQDQHWIRTDPTAWLRPPEAVRPLPAAAGPGALRPEQISRLQRTPAALREQALWQLLHDCGRAADAVLALDADQLDLDCCRTRGPAACDLPLTWREPTSDLLRWLLAGRRKGPVFITSRRAPAGTPLRDVCPVTGRARLSYRRAAEIFAGHTRPLDPAGRGWTLHQLRPAGRRAAAGAR